MKKFKNTQCRFQDTLTAVLRNSEIVLHSEPTKKKLKPNSKKHSQSKETKQLLSFQVDKINKLKKEKFDLEAKVLDLEYQLKKLSTLPVVLKAKKKTISKLKNTMKKERIKGGSCKKKLSLSLRSTPKMRSETISELGLQSTKHQTSKTYMSLPISSRNSQSGFYVSSLHDVLIKAEKVFVGWEKKCEVELGRVKVN